MLPIANPPTRQKLATVAATSTSSFLPLSLGLCSSEGAAIMHPLDTKPFESANKNKSSMKRKSELIRGAEGNTAEGVWTLQRRKSGMNKVRARESVRSRRASQMMRRGKERR